VGEDHEQAEERTHVSEGCADAEAEPPLGPRAGFTIPSRPPRARRRIAPSVARAVRRRQRDRCAVPGCRCEVMQLHHLRYREGRCEPDDLVGLCYAHHVRAHDGQLFIEGSWTGGLRFYHADGTGYGLRSTAAVLEVREKAERALVGLGFRKARVKQALARLGTSGGTEPTFEQLLRQGLAALT